MKKEAKLIFAASESCADLWYVTGFCAPDPFLWFSVDGASYMVLHTMEVPRARQQGRPGIDIIPWSDARKFCNPDDSQGGFATAEEIIKLISEKFGIDNWTVPYNFPMGLAENVRKLSGDIAFSPKCRFCPERAVKERKEIENVRQSQQLAEAGLKCAIEILQKADIDNRGILHWGNGEILLAEHLRGAINAEISRLGGSAFGTIAAPGIQGADPHQDGSGPIKAGEPIVIDIFPRHNNTGYYGDLTRTVVRGKASDTVKRAYEAVYGAQQKAFGLLKAGIHGYIVHEAVEEHFKSLGYETTSKDGISEGFFHGLGHGVGLEIHEYPHLNKNKEEVLESGNIVTVEPGLYYRSWGGIRLENTVAITENGYEDLTSVGYELEI